MKNVIWSHNDMKDLSMEDLCMRGKCHDSGHLKMVKPGEDEEHQMKDISAPVIDRKKQKRSEESVLVGPVNVGNYRFVFQADPPNPSKIPDEDIIGVTVLLLTCSYQGQEFIRVGYYVNNEYANEQLREEPPQMVQLDKI